MKYCMLSTRLAGDDGVSLEANKVAKVLERLGHRVVYCAGELDKGLEGREIPLMHFRDSRIMAISADSFKLSTSKKELYNRIWPLVDELYAAILQFLKDFSVDVIISQNSNTIPMNVPLGVAVAMLVLRNRIPCICHNHDFYWERDRFLVNVIDDLLDFAFPPKLETVRHLTISSIAQDTLFKRRGLLSWNTPNVFDFANPPPARQSDFRSAIGAMPSDWLVLQPTRVIRRKGIERSIELVHELGERAILVVTGNPYVTDEGGDYGISLVKMAKSMSIRCVWAYEMPYSLWEMYSQADLVSYPSTIEGFGNALIETVYFKKPLVVHGYPVYFSDIKKKGINAIEIDHEVTPCVVEQVKSLLTDEAKCRAVVDENYRVGIEHFSLETLERILKDVIGSFE